MEKPVNTATAAWVLVLFLAAVAPAGAQDQGKGGPPPALVTVSEIREGMIDPQAEFVGTVFYPEVSDVSSEVTGGIVEVRIEEGRRVRKGDVLVRLDAEILEKTLASTRASHEQVLVDLTKARMDFRRIENLYRQEAVAEQLYDENRFRVMSLEKKADSLQADRERLQAELRKKTVRAPFDGVTVKKMVDLGEWVSPGDKVATIARDDRVDVIVEVPGEIVGYMTPGTTLPVKAGGAETTGKVVAVIPRGDISTRTFPVKIRVRNRFSLIEGMEARVTVPTGKKRKALLVPRDALVTAMGQTVVFTVVDGRAKMVPVTVSRYVGKEVAVRTNGLKAGMEVLVKGNERVRDGQPVTLVSGQGASPQGGGKSGPPR
ncbi:MAG: efflux RND transporter periplasmic adaptor subunit [Candidatus Deferrimicrobiaceae bacterium]